ncbi:MAG: helix-turn-helix domain-containing protein [Sandaracinaceae bacterium]
MNVEADGQEVQLFREPGEGEAEALGPEGEERSVPARAPKVISVTGAKGGVGKTVIVSTLGVYLASIGRRVVLVDADPSGANLHTMLDVHRPPPAAPRGPEAAAGPLPEGWPLLETSIPNLKLLHAGLDEARAGERRPRRPRRLLDEARALDADFLVVDLGSGIAPSLIDLHLSADLGVYVTAPEPTAVENTYRFVRYAFARYCRRHVEDRARRIRITRVLQELGGAPPAIELWRRLEDDGDPLADHVRQWMEDFAPCVILNQTRLRADMELGENLRTATRRRFGIRIEYLGHIDHDDTVWSCVRSRRQVLVESPGTKAAKSMEKIARRVLGILGGKGLSRPARTVPPESHHDLLEVDRGATVEEIRRAFKRMREVVYGPDSMCCYGLFEPDELEHLRRRLEEAFDVLLDPSRRKPYELSVFPIEEDRTEVLPAAERERRSLPPAPEVNPDTDFNGSLLRQIRESQGVELKEISERTKVGTTYLAAIEQDDFRSLPAPVYVRGFVSELAKCLHLDPMQVSRTYIRRYRRYLEERGDAP